VKNKPIIIVSGEPYSVFLEIFFKVFKTNLYKKYKHPIILIGSKKIVEMQMKKLNLSLETNLIKKNQLKNIKLSNKKINLINVDLNFKKPFGKISKKSSKYIEKCFDIALDIMKNKIGLALINGPISKKFFLAGKFNGITEYLSHKTNKQGNEVMSIYNKFLSVSPITTHIPLKDVPKKISTKIILKKIITINKCTDKIIKQVNNIVDKYPKNVFLIIFADVLEKKSKLRNFFETNLKTLCIPCYLDNDKDLEIIAKAELKKNNITLSRESVNLLIEKSNNDRNNLKNEIEKIKSFSLNKKKMKLIR